MVKSLSDTTAVQVMHLYYFINHSKAGIKSLHTFGRLYIN